MIYGFKYLQSNSSCTATARRGRLLARYAGKMMARQVSGALEKWREFSAEARRLRHVCKRVAARIAGRTVSTAFDRWNEAAAETREMRAKAMKSAARIFQGVLAKVGGCTALEPRASPLRLNVPPSFW